MLSGWTLDASTPDRPEDLGGNGVIGAPGKTVTTGAGFCDCGIHQEQYDARC